MEYLKEKQHYLDLYDLFTIKDCLKTIKIFHDIYEETSKAKEIENLSEEEKKQGFNYLLNQKLFIQKGEEYKRKKETIQKWMERDKIKQDKLDNTPKPQGIHCSECKTLMVGTISHLEDYTDEPLRVLFFFECPNCKKRKGVYENGEERISKPRLCSKCKKEVKTSHKKEGQIITWNMTCSCGFIETEIDDFEKDQAEWEKEKQKDKELLEKYRSEFCLTDKKGEEYIEFMESAKYASEIYEEEKRKHDNSTYHRSLQLKMLGIVELEKHLSESLEKENYIKLTFDKPEIGQFVIVPFIIQDADSTRKENISSHNLQKILKTSLEDTNWQLMSEGIHYRLGYLSGRLKGVEREEDMLELAGKKKEPQKSVENDYDRKMKYGSSPLVQLAKLSGRHDGIENMRKKRLDKNPGGFFLEASEGPYTCCICRENTPGEKTWWNLDGLRCADCWGNIKEGTIPPLKYENEGIWISDGQIKSDYSVQPMTRKKLEREGILKARHLKRQDGSIYCTIYLIKENQEFFNKYPKKPEMDIKLTWSDDHKSFLLHSKKIDYSQNPQNKKAE